MATVGQENKVSPAVMTAVSDTLKRDIYTEQSLNLKHKFSQFCHLYFLRLKQQWDMLDTKRWSSQVIPEGFVSCITEASNFAKQYPDRDCVVRGIFVKQFEKRPNVFDLDSLLVENSLVPKPLNGIMAYCDEKDFVILEDNSSWVKLKGLDPRKIATGTVVALFGRLDSMKNFVVKEYCFCTMNGPVERPLNVDKNGNIAFISGSPPKNWEEMAQFVDFFDSQGPKMVIMAGNVVGTDIAKVSDLDIVLTVISRERPTFLMTGDEDPSGGMLPFAPLSKVFFQKSTTKDTLKLVGNPHSFVHEGLKILGTSGESVTDLLKCADFDNEPLNALQLMLESRHLAPTAPDTIPCVSHLEQDLFIMDDIPHVLFAGNQESFGVRQVHGTTLLSIPKFNIARGAVIMPIEDPSMAYFASY